MSTNEVTPIEHVPNISSPIEDDTMMNSGIIKHALRELKSVGYDIFE